MDHKRDIEYYFFLEEVKRGWNKKEQKEEDQIHKFGVIAIGIAFTPNMDYDVFVGGSICSQLDQFNKKQGISIAFHRMRSLNERTRTIIISNIKYLKDWTVVEIVKELGLLQRIREQHKCFKEGFAHNKCVTVINMIKTDIEDRMESMKEQNV